MEPIYFKSDNCLHKTQQDATLAGGSIKQKETYERRTNAQNVFKETQI